MALPDAELVLVTLLRPELPGVFVATERPPDPETRMPMVLVQRTGGASVGLWHALDQAEITAEAWSDTRKGARDLAEQVRVALHTLAENPPNNVTEHGTLSSVRDITSPFIVPDAAEAELTRRALYTAYAFLRPAQA